MRLSMAPEHDQFESPSAISRIEFRGFQSA